jgi:two-component system sensor histidine kinase UhpB
VVQENAERKRVESVLREREEQNRSLAGRLISAQEVERSRIGRELHDDVTQQLATLALALSTFRRRLPEAATELLADVTELQQQTITLTEEVRHLSHELHSGVLQHVGLAAALQEGCAEFGRQHGIAVTCDTAGGPDEIPAEVALCLYRVTQEALRNVARHACADRVEVILIRGPAGLELTIEDDGQGFDAGAVRRRGGLGLISMDERLRLVRGSVEIDSRPGGGTRVRVRAPLGGDAPPAEGEVECVGQPSYSPTTT